MDFQSINDFFTIVKNPDAWDAHLKQLKDYNDELQATMKQVVDVNELQALKEQQKIATEKAESSVQKAEQKAANLVQNAEQQIAAKLQTIAQKEQDLNLQMAVAAEKYNAGTAALDEAKQLQVQLAKEQKQIVKDRELADSLVSEYNTLVAQYQEKLAKVKQLLGE